MSKGYNVNDYIEIKVLKRDDLEEDEFNLVNNIAVELLNALNTDEILNKIKEVNQPKMSSMSSLW